MAIERKIPKDISKYESKLIGPFTTRQVVFGIPGLGLGIGCFFLLQPYLSNDVNFFIDLVVALPFLCCGWIKIHGVPFEKFVSIVFVSMFLSPKHRKYHTECVFPFFQQDVRIVKRKTGKKKRKTNKSNQPDELRKYL